MHGPFASVVPPTGVLDGLVSHLRPLQHSEDRRPSQRLDSSSATVEAYSIEESFQRRGNVTISCNYFYPGETIGPYQVPQ